MNTFVRLVFVVMFLPALILVGRFRDARARALRTILFLLILLFISVSIFFPRTIENIASLLRVNSGLDLGVYVLMLTHVSFIALSVSKIRILEKKIVTLAQELAVLRYGVEGEAKDSLKLRG